MISTRVYVEHPDLTLTPTITSLPDVEVDVVSDAGTDPQYDRYVFQFEPVDAETLEATLASDHTVADFSAIVGADDRWSYRIGYAEDTKLITPSVTDAGGLTLSATSFLEGWSLELLLEDHDALYAIDEYATEEGMRLDVLELRQAGEPDTASGVELTDPQREALVGAYVHGYFDEPRGSSLEELADRLGVSRTAVSGRLRRGSARLVEQLLVDDRERSG